jgi:hypothetical protein
VPLRVDGSTAAFQQGAPLPARSCGPPLALSAGSHLLTVAPGPFAVDDLRLLSPAPRPRPRPAPETSGSVIDSGTPGRGSYDGVRVKVTRPSWLVLGEGYNRGWQASCNGRSLGTPTPIDGYANGWRASPGCRQVQFTFAPNRLAEIGYVISGVAGIACVLLLAFGWWRRRRRGGAAEAPIPWFELDEAVARPALVPTAVAAVAGGFGFGFVFGVIPGLVAVPAIALVLWLGIGARALTLAAAALLAVVVPILYLVHPGDQSGGSHFGYAMAHLGAHYVGVAAIGMLILALWRTLSAAIPRGVRK